MENYSNSPQEFYINLLKDFLGKEDNKGYKLNYSFNLEGGGTSWGFLEEKTALNSLSKTIKKMIPDYKNLKLILTSKIPGGKSGTFKEFKSEELGNIKGKLERLLKEK
ncbi:hypothetical protein J4411_01815 [Candidatus Pacearchaeota archaeon]|nr:hypothetical protein [Candidatus Pacearchaeota archaeon]